MARRRLGEVLLDRKVITPTQLEEALVLQRRTRQRLGMILVQRGFLTERALIQALADATGMDVVDLDQVPVEWAAVHLLRAEFCEAQLLFPYAIEKGRSRKSILVAVSDPLNIPALEQVQRITQLPPTPKLASVGAVQRAIDRYYRKGGAGAPIAGPGAKQAARAAGYTEDFIEEESGEIPLADEVGPVGSTHYGTNWTPDSSSRGSNPTLELASDPTQAKELRAIVRILIRKGLLSQREIDAEIAAEPAYTRR